MKISAFLCSYGPLFEQGVSVCEVIDRAAAQGFGAIEPFPCAGLETVDEARRVGAYIRDKGLAVSCYSTGCELLGPDSAAVLLGFGGLSEEGIQQGTAMLRKAWQTGEGR